jgi:hypothetical protein
MLDDVQDQIVAWLDREPTISALEVLQRLKSAHPERFNDSHVRTVKRAVKAWRGRQARRSAIVVGAGVGGPVPDEQAAPPPPGPPPRGSPTWVHRDLPRIAASDSWPSLRDARVPPMDYVDDPHPRKRLGNVLP